MHGYSHHMEYIVTSPPYSVFCLFSPSYMNDWSLPAEMLSNELDETVLSELASAVLFELWFYNGVVSLRNLWLDKILMFLTFGIVSICLGHRK